MYLLIIGDSEGGLNTQPLFYSNQSFYSCLFFPVYFSLIFNVHFITWVSVFLSPLPPSSFLLSLPLLSLCPFIFSHFLFYPSLSISVCPSLSPSLPISFISPFPSLTLSFSFLPFPISLPPSYLPLSISPSFSPSSNTVPLSFFIYISLPSFSMPLSLLPLSFSLSLSSSISLSISFLPLCLLLASFFFLIISSSFC